MEEELTIRRKQEIWEHQFLSPYAVFSDQSAGRDKTEETCKVRTVFQRDRDRIVHSKAFRRLKGKTQVFLSPEGDHYRTRLTHTLEVSQTARTIAKALRLNEDLTEAIALGHDLGHTPYGHTGEKALNRVCEGGFKHNLQSIRVVETLEKHGDGLNLTKEVRDGILNHQTAGHPITLEGKIVRLSDKIAYLNHDIDDAIRAHILKEEELPKEYTDILGHSLKERLSTLVLDIIQQSDQKKEILMSKEVECAMMNLRQFMFEHVYTNKIVKSQEQKAICMVEQLFEYYIEHIEQLPEEFADLIRKQKQPIHRVVCDYIAGMTDHYAVTTFQDVMIPKSWDIY